MSIAYIEELTFGYKSYIIKPQIIWFQEENNLDDIEQAKKILENNKNGNQEKVVFFEPIEDAELPF